MAISEYERAILGELSWEEAVRHIRWFVREAPGRYAGIEGEEKAADYIRETLSRWGIDAGKFEIEAYVGLPAGAHLKILAPEKMEIEASPRAPSRGPVSGEILLIETTDDYRKRRGEVEGRIIMVPYSFVFPISPEEVRERKGTGFIIATWGDENSQVRRFDTPQNSAFWGAPTPDELKKEREILPQIYISRKDFETLKRLCSRGKVSAAFEAALTSKWVKAHPVIAEVKSTKPTEDFILLGGHFDSWDPGATDNAAGASMMMELARVFQKYRGTLGRNIRLGFWTGHENGTYAASTWYLDRSWDEIADHGISLSVFDTPGFRNAPEYSVQASEELADFAVGCARDILGRDAKLDVVRPAKNSDRGFFGIGLPSLFIRNSFSREQVDNWHGGILGWWNHTPEDTMDKVGEDNYCKTMQIRALEIVRLCNSNVLPFDFSKVAAGFRERLEGWNSIPGLDLENTKSYAQMFHEKIRKFMGSLEKDKLDQSSSKKVNELLKGLARILTLVNYATRDRYDQDVFGTDLSKPLVALKDLDRISEVGKGSPEEVMFLAGLIKQKNRVNDALKESIRLIDGF